MHTVPNCNKKNLKNIHKEERIVGSPLWVGVAKGAELEEGAEHGEEVSSLVKGGGTL